MNLLRKDILKATGFLQFCAHQDPEAAIHAVYMFMTKKQSIKCF